jgi:hypothetical protein
MDTEILHRIDRDVAWNVLQDNFDRAKSRRFVSGIVLSSGHKNANGDAFKAQGLKVKLPIPLLWSHDWLRPIGRVDRIETRCGQVAFVAEIANNARLSWAEDVWCGILNQRAAAASVGPRNLSGYPAIDRVFNNWELREVSIVVAGADRGARILRVWEIAPTVSLYRPSQILHWSSPS